MDCVIEETGEFGLCCFDGCQNTCLKKTCEIVDETKIDFVEQQKCSDEVRVECKNKPGTVFVIYLQGVTAKIFHFFSTGWATKTWQTLYYKAI